MMKSVRALLALVSFSFAASLFAGEFTTSVSSGQQLAISVAGTTGGDIWVIDLNTNQTVVMIWLGTNQPGSYTSDYYYNGGPTQSGPISLVDYGSGSAVIYGLPAGNYKVICGNLIDYYSYQSGNTYYFFQRNAYYTEWLDFSFEVY